MSIISVPQNISFPLKLYNLMEVESTDVVSWSEKGTCFKVVNAERFSNEIVPKYFRHTKMTSFQRQLNLYGFRRLMKGVDSGCYFHPQFQRDKKDLVAEIRRVSGKSNNNSNSEGSSERKGSCNSTTTTTTIPATSATAPVTTKTSTHMLQYNNNIKNHLQDQIQARPTLTSTHSDNILSFTNSPVERKFDGNPLKRGTSDLYPPAIPKFRKSMGYDNNRHHVSHMHIPNDSSSSMIPPTLGGRSISLTSKSSSGGPGHIPVFKDTAIVGDPPLLERNFSTTLLDNDHRLPMSRQNSLNNIDTTVRPPILNRAESESWVRLNVLENDLDPFDIDSVLNDQDPNRQGSCASLLGNRSNSTSIASMSSQQKLALKAISDSVSQFSSAETTSDAEGDSDTSECETTALDQPLSF